MAHTELGLELLQRLAVDMQEHATVEAEPKVDGRNMVMVLAPIKPRIRAVPESAPNADDLLGGPFEVPATSPEPEPEPGTETETEPETSA